MAAAAKLKPLTLALRVLLEAGIVAALAYWGYRTGRGTAGRVLLAIGAPLVGFGFWGLVDFRWAGRMGEPLRLAQELLVSALAAVALFAAGAPVLGWALAAVSLIYHLLVYLLGGRLLRR